MKLWLNVLTTFFPVQRQSSCQPTQIPRPFPVSSIVRSVSSIT